MVDSQGFCDLEQWMQPLLEMEWRKLPPAAGAQLSEGLRSTNVLRYLGLRGNLLGDPGVIAMIRGLKENRGLEILDLSDNKITDKGVVCLSEYLQESSCTLQSLVLDYNKIKKVGGVALSNVLKSNRRLLKLSLEENKIRCEGTAAIAKALEVNSTLQHLNLSRNEVNIQGGQALAQMMTANHTLQSLNISCNKLGSSFVSFGSALTQNKTLMEVDVHSNLISANHAKDFGSQLCAVFFGTFNIAQNDIGDDGVMAILDCFTARANIRLLDFTSVGMTERGLREVTRLVGLCPMLEMLQIGGNQIGSVGISQLAAAIRDDAHLRGLNVCRCGMDTAASVTLALALHQHPWFSVLDISGNRITDEAITSLCYSLKRMTSLQHVNLSGNEITQAAKAELASVFINNPSLSCIHLKGNPIAVEFVNGVLSRSEATRIVDNLPDLAGVKVTPYLTAPKSQTSTHSTHFQAGTVVLPALYVASPSSTIRNQSFTSSPVVDITSLEGTPGIPWPVKPASSLIPVSCLTSTTRSVNTATSPGAVGVAEGAMSLVRMETLAALAEDEATRQNHTYPPLIPSKASLEHSYYPGFGRSGRFCNASHAQAVGELSHTIYNSQGFPKQYKWCHGISTADTMFATGLRRVAKAYPYSEMILENNLGGLLVTERQLRQAFHELDVEGRGWIEGREFAQLFQTFENFGIPLKLTEVNKYLEKYRRRNPTLSEDRITFEEFSLLMLSVVQR